MHELLLAFRIARRELRGGLRGFGIFLACLTLGVGAIATVQSLAAGILEGLREDGQAILGGDLEVRQIYQPATPEQLDHFRSIAAAVSATADLRSMARSADGRRTTLIELKAVDEAYPLYGTVQLDDGHALQSTLARVDGAWGAVAEESVLARLDLAVGDVVRVGEAAFQIRGTILREPDRASGVAISIGPRLMIARAALEETGLVQPGSLIYHHYRLRLAPGTDVQAAAEAVTRRFPEAGWRVRDSSNAAPQVQRMIERLALFLTLVGLTALLVGGVGVGNAVRAHLDGKIASIATLKCLGAPGRLVFRIYLAQILALAALGIALGLAAGAAAPLAVGALVADLLPVQVRVGLYPEALALAAGFGLLTALTFSLWPLARAREIPAASLFRDVVAPARGRPRPVFVIATAVAALALGGLAVASAEQPGFALYFVLGAAATFLAFRGAAWLVVRGARRLGRPRWPGLRLALANLHRPGAPTGAVVLSLGLGLTVLVAIALIQGNLSRLVRDSLPQGAPTFFFIDIQPDQAERFNALVTGINGVSDLQEVPSLRGRIVAVNGRPAEQALVAPEHGWLIRGDRGVTYAATPRAEETVIAGGWWPPDYAGPPLVSIYRDIADGFGIGPGDRLTVNVLGRDIEAEVANIRDIEWRSLAINFTMIFSPRPLAAAPHTLIATVRAEGPAAAAVQHAVAEAFPNVSAIRVQDALDTVNDVLAKIGTAVRSTAAITLVAGTLVLAGAIAAGHRRRVYDAVVLKVLGARRTDVLRVFLIEYGLLGLIAAAIAAAIGTLAAWAVVTQVMEIEWVFVPQAVLTTAALATGITLAFGFVGTWRALGQKPAPLLRNE